MVRKSINLILVVFLILVSCAVVYADPFYTTDQIMNKVYDAITTSLKTTAFFSGSVTLDTSEIATVFKYTVFKRYTLSPNTDSGTNLGFTAECKKWSVINLGDTAPVYIKFESAASITDFKIPATASIYGSSKVTTIHVISEDTAEVETIGLY